jgi:hypothetical protein
MRFHEHLSIINIKNIVYFDVPKHFISKKFQERNTCFFP